MEHIRKSLLWTLICCMIFAPGQSRATNKLFITGLCAGSVALTAATIYLAAKNRPITSKPTPTNLTCIGNEQGQPIIYSHGLGCYFGDAYLYIKEDPYVLPYIFDPAIHHIATFNYPDSGFENGSRGNIKRDQVTLGQKNDIDRLTQAVDEFDKANILAFGTSRGASTLITMMATKQNGSIRAMILEAPFSSIKEALVHIYGPKNFFKSVPFIKTAIGSTAHAVTSAMFPQYDPNGIQPIDVIDEIDPEIPILLIHSRVDTTCPIDGTRQLYIKRRLQGCTNVYLLELIGSRHGRGLYDGEGELFQNVVHAFYKEYGFAHNEDFACKINLEDYQPSVEKVLKRISG